MSAEGKKMGCTEWGLHQLTIYSRLGDLEKCRSLVGQCFPARFRLPTILLKFLLELTAMVTLKMCRIFAKCVQSTKPDDGSDGVKTRYP